MNRTLPCQSTCKNNNYLVNYIKLLVTLYSLPDKPQLMHRAKGVADMSETFTPYLNEKAWLFHRGRWSSIKNPLYGKVSSVHSANSRRQKLRQILQGYDRRCWILGPTFLLPHYSGTLVYTYAQNGEGIGPKYLIWIDTIDLREIIFAQDLPDLLSILALLTPIVHLDILVDVYKRGMDAYMLSQNHRQGQ
jgi:hypothetical protein